jgi:hypothetical protein
VPGYQLPQRPTRRVIHNPNVARHCTHGRGYDTARLRGFGTKDT